MTVTSSAPPTLSAEELADLRRARFLLERPSLATHLTRTLGKPIEYGFRCLPWGWNQVIQRSTQGALNKALGVATFSLWHRPGKPASESLHRWAVGGTGLVGGVFGLAALPWELPLSTTMMLRSIADIARSEGHFLKSPETRVACLEVFALGGTVEGASPSESPYWIMRAMLAKSVSQAATYLASRGAVEETAPALVRLIAAIGARFGVIISEQVAAKAIPLVGAAAGSAINLVFIKHFQDTARGHFILKRLEQRHGEVLVKDLYHSVALPYHG